MRAYALLHRADDGYGARPASRPSLCMASSIWRRVRAMPDVLAAWRRCSSPTRSVILARRSRICRTGRRSAAAEPTIAKQLESSR